jgi:pimeloyl-ACP methyl ester carboxylesterase
MSEQVETPPLGRHYDVDGRRLSLYVSGSGGPAVVFLPGAGLVGLDFLNVHQRVAEFTTAVSYDRAGTGWSSPAELPASATEAVDELRSLLAAAGVPGPYVLAGHSLGGLHARRFAQRYPSDVAGLVLLDPAHEDMPARMPAALRDLLAELDSQPLPELSEEQRGDLGAGFARALSEWPADLRELLVARHVNPVWMRAGALERRNLEEIYAELRAGGPPPSRPLIVLTAAAHDPAEEEYMTPETQQEWDAVKLALHAELAASVPRGEQRVVEGAAHSTFQTDEPDAVVDAIRDVLNLLA